MLIINAVYNLDSFQTQEERFNNPANFRVLGSFSILNVLEHILQAVYFGDNVGYSCISAINLKINENKRLLKLRSTFAVCRNQKVTEIYDIETRLLNNYQYNKFKKMLVRLLFYLMDFILKGLKLPNSSLGSTTEYQGSFCRVIACVVNRLHRHRHRTITYRIYQNEKMTIITI